MATLRETIAMLAAAYPTRPIQQETLDVYVAALSDLPPDDVERAAVEHVRSARWFPTVAELIDRVVEARLRLPDAPQAWEMFERAASTRTGWRDLPPTVRAAADAMGGPFSLRATDNVIAFRSQFFKAYEARRAEAVAAAREPGALGAPDERRAIAR